jgi:hypothetical protein
MVTALARKAGLLDDETGLHVLTLSPLLLMKLGPEFLMWESAALREELEDLYGSIGPVTWERIQALRVLHVHNAFWTEWEVFENVTAAILGEPPIFSFTQPPEPEEIAIALVTAAKIDSHTYSDEVLSYMTAACLFDGMWYLDEAPLSVARGELREFDLRRNIDRDFGGVAALLSENPKGRFSVDPVTSNQVQADKVLEVRRALQRYDAAVTRQLKSLPSTSQGK